mmetsp:Transcript_43427/g.112133  ORF Transcript_43427/g.112133 Transcript_43427/m.112133 type:complete len:201 (+) Transcript_43427:1538-2140(+)
MISSGKSSAVSPGWPRPRTLSLTGEQRPEPERSAANPCACDASSRTGAWREAAAGAGSDACRSMEGPKRSEGVSEACRDHESWKGGSESCRHHPRPLPNDGGSSMSCRAARSVAKAGASMKAASLRTHSTSAFLRPGEASSTLLPRVGAWRAVLSAMPLDVLDSTSTCTVSLRAQNISRSGVVSGSVAAVAWRDVSTSLN